MSPAVSNGKYDADYFHARALNSLKKIGDGLWDYSDSLLLYTPGTEQGYESIQKGDDPYAELITKPERTYLKKIAHDIVAKLPDRFEFVDLGPGTAHKEQFIFDAAKTQGKKFTYVPVDISDYYLKFAAGHATAQNIPTSPLQSSFEELPQKLTSAGPRFVSLGLTFTNYDPKEILQLLNRIAGPNGFIFVSAQIRDRIDMENITRIYKEDVRIIIDPKIELLDLDPITDISKYETDDGVRMWCALKNTNATLNFLGIRPGDKLLMLQSLRYTKETLEAAIASSGLKYSLLDTGDTFIGALIRSK